MHKCKADSNIFFTKDYHFEKDAKHCTLLPPHMRKQHKDVLEQETCRGPLAS